MDKEKIGCICLTCGIRNDYSHPDGMCQNGHDDWLEWRDISGEGMFEDEQRIIKERVMELTGWDEVQIAEAFLNPLVTRFPILRSLHEEIDDITMRGEPFDWNTIEINEWELGYRMLRADGDCVCPLCKKKYKEHSMETRTAGEPWLHQICTGFWAKL